MNWANYLIQINLYLAVFYIFYQLFLKDETFFNLNRTYLLGAAFFSMMIPVARVQWVKSLFITEQVQTGWTNVNVRIMQGFASPLVNNNTWALGDYLTLVYLFVFTVLMLRLIYKLIKVKQLFKSENSSEAFSFFGKIRINPNLTNLKEIEKHELTHAKQLHSADVIFFEILAIINWFNPVCYLYKKSIKHIHEFIADEEAVKLSDKKEYAILLFSKSFGVKPNQLTNNFFNQSLLKRRIKMLNKQKSRKAAILKYGLSAPLFLLAIILSSAKISENKMIDKVAKTVQPKQEIINVSIPKNIKKMITGLVKKPIVEIVIDTSVFKDLRKHLGRNLRYPPIERSNSNVAKVSLTFDVNEDGNIDNVKANTFSGFDFEKEGIRALELFKDKLNVAPSNYSIILNYALQGDKMIVDNETDLGIIKNYIGEVMIVGYLPKAEDKKAIILNPQSSKDPIFQNVEVLPSFPGGLQAFGKFLGGNLNYPKAAKDAKIEGRVYAQFVVEKDGSLTEVKIVRRIGYGCDEEAKRVLELSPKWNPGVQNGEKVRVIYTVPIFFQINKKVNFPPPISNDFIEKSLFLIDGVEYHGSERINIVKNEVSNILKGEAATIKYGEKGKNGVIEITTKKKD
ncbi:hypothetical protein A5893_16645 [Pedobacter psychrophilus]|uniref:TonB C-terminal domain-containing protein n=1 Tax=Pedobacter psychrophilus TaxID=1826909 RepID=A0A179DAB8_9SPHI|nr:M56 family metallopeptidase [Pedobacter psychrophilus]OAQ37996.1 hypothetical protein A5893_16645 [Pedobacter psychrophilus]